MWFDVPGKHEENSPTIRDIRNYLAPQVVDISMLHCEKTRVDQMIHDLEIKMVCEMASQQKFIDLQAENSILKQTLEDLLGYLQFKGVVNDEDLTAFFDARAVAERLKRASEPSKENMPPNEVKNVAVYPSRLETLATAARNSFEPIQIKF